MDNPTHNSAPKQIMQWQMIGAEPVFERGTVRLPQFRKTFAADQQVMVRDQETGELTPFLLGSGRPLLCNEILPERADLALSDKGVLLTQPEFRERYMVYLQSFSMPESSDPSVEPIPNVANFINKKPDIYSESGGLVAIDADLSPNKAFKPARLYGPDGETEEEYLAKREESQDIKALLAKLTEATASLAAERGQSVAVEETRKNATPVEMSQSDDRESAPCGASVKKGYVKQHERHCKDERCNHEDAAA